MQGDQCGSLNIAFDFDKTLTYKDSFDEFVEFLVRKKRYKKLKLIYILIMRLLHKLGVISNLEFKAACVRICFSGFSSAELEALALEFAKKIETNELYRSLNWPALSDNIFVISASPEIYLKHLFPENIIILGTKIACNNQKFTITRNTYGIEKQKLLLEQGVNGLDLFFTDSKADAPLIEMSNRFWWVKGDGIQEGKNDSFRSDDSKWIKINEIVKDGSISPQ